MHEFYGKHVLAEFILISSVLINDINKLVEITRSLIVHSGATIIETKIYEFKPRGYTIFFVLKESHVSIHSYPEYGAMFLDAFTCGHKIDPQLIVNGLCDYLVPQQKNIQIIERKLQE